jgi:hypothetical protein
MPQPVIHQPRVAWDAARTIVSIAGTADDELLIWLATRIDHVLGHPCRLALLDTHHRLNETPQQGTPIVETGRWRVRLEDLLRSRPDLTEDVHLLTLDAATRLRG